VWEGIIVRVGRLYWVGIIITKNIILKIRKRTKYKTKNMKVVSLSRRKHVAFS